MLGDARDVLVFCHDTDGLVSQLATLKLGSLVVGSYCLAQTALQIASDQWIEANCWAGAGLVCVTLGRMAWQRLSISEPFLRGQRARRLVEGLRGGSILAWSDSSAGELVRDPRFGMGNGCAVLLRPDKIARWFGVWGHFTRPIAPLLTLNVQQAVRLIANAQSTRLLRVTSRRALRTCGLDTPRDLSGDTVPAAVIVLPGPVWGKYRGKRSIDQLIKSGEFNRWLLLSETCALALANEVWGPAPGRPDHMRARLAFLTANRIVAHRGTSICLLDVTREVTDRLSQLGGPLGLNGGEDGGWIALMIRGQYRPIMNQLAAGYARLEGLEDQFRLNLA